VASLKHEQKFVGLEDPSGQVRLQVGVTMQDGQSDNVKLTPVGTEMVGAHSAHRNTK